MAPDATPTFLPGLPGDLIEAMLRRSPGHELVSGKFHSAESSSALTANGFGRFIVHPRDLPPLPGVPMGQAQSVTLEAEMRFPWEGGRHPWLDVAVETATTLVGVESKRYEPFRPAKANSFSGAFDARDWGVGMAHFTRLRQDLEAGKAGFQTLDAVQLVKQAYGLRTQAGKRAKGAVLVYLYAEPPRWASGKPVDPARIARHRVEVADFAHRVKGDDVVFAALRWSDLLTQWAGLAGLSRHAGAVMQRYGSLS